MTDEQIEPAVPTSTFELLDAAAERGHNAMFEGDLPAEGIERDLWHKVALAVLDDPRLLPAWARGARVDADNWRRQCSTLDAERDLLLWLHAEAVFFGEGWNEQWLATRRTAGLAMQRMNEFADARDQLKARIDAALAELLRGGQAAADVRRAAIGVLQGDQPELRHKLGHKPDSGEASGEAGPS